MKNYDISLHVKGQSQFVDDVSLPEGTLHAAVFTAPAAHGIIRKMDFGEAMSIDGVVDILTSADITGQNQIGHIIHDEPLLASEVFEYCGQPIAIVLAKNVNAARQAAKMIKIEYESLPFVLDPREAFKKGQIIGKERTFAMGNTDEAWQNCAYIFSGKVESGAQEHLYLEPQGAVALPMESGRIKIISSTQSPSSVQKTVADVLGVPLNQIEVDVTRIGGGFGGKEDQANAWAAMAGLASKKTGQPVKLILSRPVDMAITGKRHPYSSDFKIGLTEDLKILAYEVQYFQNAGAYADLSPAILERTMFHMTNSYFIPNVKGTGVSCRTNLPPNTAFRGFGGPQAMYVMECAIYEAAVKLNVLPSEIQQKNLIGKGELFPYGMEIKNNNVIDNYFIASGRYNLHEKMRNIQVFNAKHQYLKKGLSIMPICFGISFTSTFLNQANALVHIYNDGSVGISTGAIEMGQGVAEKIRMVAATVLGIFPDRIRIESTNTSRIANISATAASSGADLNGHATRLACEQLRDRLIKAIPVFSGLPQGNNYLFRDEKLWQNGTETSLDWNTLIGMAYRNRTGLTSQAYYATPEIFFDREKEKGTPFSYHVTGTGILEVTLDCRRGTFETDSVNIVHDGGKSFVPKIDQGQMEGGLVQGIAWMTMEEVVYAETGKVLTNMLSTYKIPDMFSVPKEINIHFLESAEYPDGIMGSKAIGEPPFLYGIGMYFAVLNAMRSFNPAIQVNYSAPMTNEKILTTLYNK